MYYFFFAKLDGKNHLKFIFCECNINIPFWNTNNNFSSKLISREQLQLSASISRNFYAFWFW